MKLYKLLKAIYLYETLFNIKYANLLAQVSDIRPSWSDGPFVKKEFWNRKLFIKCEKQGATNSLVLLFNLEEESIKA